MGACQIQWKLIYLTRMCKHVANLYSYIKNTILMTDSADPHPQVLFKAHDPAGSSSK